MCQENVKSDQAETQACVSSNRRRNFRESIEQENKSLIKQLARNQKKLEMLDQWKGLDAIISDLLD